METLTTHLSSQALTMRVDKTHGGHAPTAEALLRGPVPEQPIHPAESSAPAATTFLQPRKIDAPPHFSWLVSAAERSTYPLLRLTRGGPSLPQWAMLLGFKIRPFGGGIHTLQRLRIAEFPLHRQSLSHRHHDPHDGGSKSCWSIRCFHALQKSRPLRAAANWIAILHHAADRRIRGLQRPDALHLEPLLISPYWIARDFPWLKPIAQLMPAWLVPANDPASPTILNYWLGIDPVRGGHMAPLVEFLLPMSLWAILISAVLGAAFFLAAVFRKQWVYHERLTFPLATIPLELMAPPEQGRYYNQLWRNPLLWAGAAIPFMVYLLAGLHAQFPAVPFLDLQYNFADSFTDRPWDAAPSYIQPSRASICRPIRYLLFFPGGNRLFHVVFSCCSMALCGSSASPPTFDLASGENTTRMGTYVAYFLGILWLARGHLRYVVTSAINKSPRAEDEPLTYRTMVLGLCICGAVAWIWLSLAGMNPLAAFLLLALGAMLVTLMARIVVETGLFFVGPIFWPNQIFTTLLSAKLLSLKTMYWTQITSRLFFADLRETLMPYAANSLHAWGRKRPRRRPTGNGCGCGWRWSLLVSMHRLRFPSTIT